MANLFTSIITNGPTHSETAYVKNDFPLVICKKLRYAHILKKLVYQYNTDQLTHAQHAVSPLKMTLSLCIHTPLTIYLLTYLYVV